MYGTAIASTVRYGSYSTNEQSNDAKLLSCKSNAHI